MSAESLTTVDPKTIRQRIVRKITFALMTDPRTEIIQGTEAESHRQLDLDDVPDYGRVMINLSGGIQLWASGHGECFCQIFNGGVTGQYTSDEFHTFDGRDLNYGGESNNVRITSKDGQIHTPSKIASLLSAEQAIDSMLSAVESSK